MNYLFITQHYDPEPIAPSIRISAIVKILKKRGHIVEVVTSIPNYPMGKVYDKFNGKFYSFKSENGIGVHRIGGFYTLGIGLKRILSYLVFCCSTLFIPFFSRKPDLIFIEASPIILGIPGIFFKYLWKTPIVMHFADLTIDIAHDVGILKKGLKLTFLRKIENLILQESNFISISTKHDHNFLINKRNVDPLKILFLPNGADTIIFYPSPYNEVLAAQLNIMNRNVVIYVGNHGYMHGLEFVLLAAQYLEELNYDITFLFIGGGMDKEKLIKKSKTLGLKSTIFIDPVHPKKLHEYYSLSKIGICTLRNKKTLEHTRLAKISSYMASGIPVLFCGNGETGQVIKDAKAGVVIKRNDPIILANKISDLLAEKDRLIKFSQNGRKYIEQNLSWESIVDNWLNQLNNKLQ